MRLRLNAVCCHEIAKIKLDLIDMADAWLQTAY